MNTLPLLFNDVDGYEVLVIVLVVLIFFGPKSIPGIAKSLGRAFYSIRNASDELKNEIRKSGVDIKKDLNVEEILKQQGEQLIQPMDQVYTDIGNTVHFEGNKVDHVIKKQTEQIPIEGADPITPSEPITQETKPDNLKKDEI